MNAAVSWVWGYISDFEWWETVAKLAPIGAALIALGAAGIALWAILAQRNIARRRAAIDFFFKTEMDDKAIELYNKFKKRAPLVSSAPEPWLHEDYEDIRTFLNICELIAVGVNKRTFSRNVSFHYWRDVIPKSYRTTEELINRIRNTPEHGSPYTYIELEKLAKRWDKGAAGGSFRLWLVVSIVWIAAIWILAGAWLL